MLECKETHLRIIFIVIFVAVLAGNFIFADDSFFVEDVCHSNFRTNRDSIPFAPPVNYNDRNFPNPFSTFTIISFNVSRKDADETIIEIYNIKGQKIRQYSIFNPSKAGHGNQSSITWDGNDDRGRRAANGIYYYSFKSDNIILETQKMILLRN